MLVQRLYDDLFNRGRLALAGEFVTATFVDHAAPTGTPPGPAGLRTLAAQLRAAFPDGRHVIEDLIAEADRVAVRLTFRGTHSGAGTHILPVGQHLVQAQIHILHIVAGKASERWAVGDGTILGFFA